MKVIFGKKRHCILQHDQKDCGIACLATIALHYGRKVQISRLREMAGTDLQGTNAFGLIQAAQRLGFTAKGVKGDKAAFFSEFPLPAIAHVIVDRSLLHYVVIHKITPKQIIVADPAKGIVKYTPDDFFKIWTGVLLLMVPAAEFAKGSDAKGIFSRFFSLLVPQKKLLAHIFFASVLYTVLGIFAAFYFKFLMDDIVPYGLKKTLHLVSVGIVALYLFKVLLNAFRSHLLLYLSQKLDLSLILGYYRHVLGLPMSFFSTRKVGEIISRLMDASKVREAISGATLTMMIDTLMVVVGGVILYVQSAFLFGITVALVPLYIAIVWAFHRPFKSINEKQMEENAQLTSYMVESMNGMETVKSYNAEWKADDETEKKFVRLLRTMFKLGWIHNLQGSIKGFVELVGGVAILWAGAYQVMQGKMSFGQLLTYNALLAYFLQPIQNLINLQPMMQTAVVASRRLGEILDLELERAEHEDKKIVPASLRGSIELRNVDFRYGTRALILKNINLTIAPGEKIAFVGESGSGKTTLVKLLLNFYPYEKGDILINRYNLQDINLDALRSKIAYIPQENFFFSGTIRDNLCLGLREEPPFERVIEVAEMARAHEFINRLPLRYQTMLEESGSNLSGGQRQRLAIARALLKNPDILMMDEATSNLDSTTEKAISETIQQIGRDVTTIIIAHRLSTIMRCDRIVVMDNGTFAETGTHQELMLRKGKYYELWKDQLPANEGLPDSSEQPIHEFVQGKAYA